MAARSREQPASQPGKQELEAALGPSAGLWSQLQHDLVTQFGPLAEKWSFSKKTTHWALQLKQKTRTVLYLVPSDEGFVASFALSERACLAARASKLPVKVRDLIDTAPRYPEGRAVRLEVCTRRDLETVKVVAAIKMAN